MATFQQLPKLIRLPPSLTQFGTAMIVIRHRVFESFHLLTNAVVYVAVIALQN